MTPTIKTLTARLNISKEKANEIRKLMKGEVMPDTYESVGKWLAQCFNPPSNVELIMCAINEVLGAHGVEAIFDNNHSMHWDYPAYEYCNMGDTYATTVIYDYSKSRFIVASYGDMVEIMGS